MLLLNARNVVIDQERVYQGNVSASVVRVGELFRRAVERHASSIILCHNHPSGEVKPSVNDLELTTQAIKAGHLLDIAVIDHLIVGGGLFSSLREYGVAFDRPVEHRAGEAASGPPWRNPWLGTFKSCLQKAIRRDESAKAAWAAEGLLSLPGGRSALARRLPVITAEDVGARWLPAVGQAILSTDGLPLEVAGRTLTFIASSLASLPKDRTCAYLATVVWNRRRKPTSTGRAGLAAAIAAGLHEDALAICFDAVDRRQFRSGERAIDALVEALAGAPDLANEIGRWGLSRERLGGSTGECLAAAVIAAIDKPDGPVPELPMVAYDRLPGSTQPDWIAIDQHTALGSRVLARRARLLGMSPAALGLLMFDQEGIRCAPTELPSRWRDAALDTDALEGGWGTQEAGHQLWHSIKDTIQADIELALEHDPHESA